MAEVKRGTKKAPVRKARRASPGRRLPGFFSDYGGSGIVVDSMPGQKSGQKSGQKKSRK